MTADHEKSREALLQELETLRAEVANLKAQLQDNHTEVDPLAQSALYFQQQLRALHEVNILLTGLADLDGLCRQAVELGSTRLGLDRLGLFLFDAETRILTPVFRVGADGQIHDLRDGGVNFQDTQRALAAFESGERLKIWEDVPLYDKSEISGQGWYAMAMLWNGETSIGWLIADNLVHQQPISESQLEIMTLYASILGHLITRQRALEKLCRFEERFNKAFYANPTAVTINVLGDGRYVDVNDAWLEMWGYTRQDILDNPHKITVFADLQERQRLLELIRQNGSLPPYEFTGIKKSGELVRALMAVETIELDGVPHILTMMQDITARKRAEESLVRSEMRYRTLVRNLPNTAVMLYDHDLRYILVDGPEVERAGFSKARLEGKTPAEGLEPEMARSIEPVLRQVLEGNTIVMEISYNGFTYLANYIPLYDADGKVVNGMALTQNITERKRAEDALHYRLGLEQMLSSVLTQLVSAPVKEIDCEINRTLQMLAEFAGAVCSAVFLFSEDLRLLRGSHEWFLDPADSILASHHNISTDSAPLFMARLKQFQPIVVSRSEENLSTSTPFRPRLFLPMILRGRLYGALGFAGALSNPHEWPESLVRLYRFAADAMANIIERSQADKEREALIRELEARNAELNQFTYTVSHDLKSPLITIKGFLGYLQTDVAGNDVARMNADVQYIQSAVDKMEQLLDELLELSRVGRITNPPQAEPLEALIQEALDLLSGRLTARDVKVVVMPDLPAVYGDRRRLLEVFQNVIENAAKFMDDQPAPHIEIQAERRETTVHCSVKDNGRGIQPRYFEKIFGLFERLDANGEGTGIGLALVKRIIEVHGGRIWVESEGLGCGSTFHFTLPAAP